MNATKEGSWCSAKAVFFFIPDKQQTAKECESINNLKKNNHDKEKEKVQKIDNNVIKGSIQ